MIGRCRPWQYLRCQVAANALNSPPSSPSIVNFHLVPLISCVRSTYAGITEQSPTLLVQMQVVLVLAHTPCLRACNCKFGLSGFAYVKWPDYPTTPGKACRLGLLGCMTDRR